MDGNQQLRAIQIALVKLMPDGFWQKDPCPSIYIHHINCLDDEHGRAKKTALKLK